VSIGLEGAVVTVYTHAGIPIPPEGQIMAALARKDAELAHKDAELARKDAELAFREAAHAAEIEELRRQLEELRGGQPS
jgi:hypothetical protein